MTTVFRVSKQGEDALTETDPNSFIFNSSLNTFKILATGTAGGTINSGTTTFTVAHNQGATPAVYAFAKFPDGYVAMPDEKPRDEADPINRYWRGEVDSTNMYFVFYRGTASNYSATVSYYVFEAPV